MNDLKALEFTTNMLDPGITKTLPLQGQHSTLGLIVQTHPEYKDMIILRLCQPGTISHRHI